MAFGIAAIGAEIFNSPLFVALKPLCTVSILAYLLLFRNTAIKSYSKRIGIGLFFCLIGDAFLLFESYFIWGLASFLVAHLIFLYAFVKRQGWLWEPRVAVVLALIAVGVFTLVSDDLYSLFYPVLIYLIVIVLMSWQGWALALNPKMEYRSFLGWGVSLFLFSDALIAIDKFYYSFSFSGISILSTYWIAIFLIARSASK
jgi:uncharacterized membrane protein YhhN|tara:strand:- start:220 stop:822 length:603 start_codon:yes stop_codon:yes gene_type:complete